MTCAMLAALAFSLHVRGEKVRRAPAALLGEQVGGLLMAAPAWLPPVQEVSGRHDSH